MFSLGEEVSRYERRVGAGACDDHQFTRPGWHINGGALKLNQLLGAGNVPVSRAEDLIYSRY